MKSETILQNQIRLELSRHGIVVRQNVGSFLTTDGRRVVCGIPGMTDLMYIGQGIVAFIEVKTDAGKVRPEQQNFIDTVKKLGHRAGIARSVEDALKIIGGEA
jgi:hypothetical protein